MNANDLIAEGERLSRPSLFLSDKPVSELFIGIWGGKGLVDPGPGPWKHWLSLDCSWLAKQGLPLEGIISVYTNEDDCQTGTVVHERTGRLPTKPRKKGRLLDPKRRISRLGGAGRSEEAGEIALYGQEVASFPPIEAVFEFGNKSVKKWLRSLGLPNRDQWDPYFQAREATGAYDEEFRKRCPLYDSELGTAAVLAGWHCMWPEGDWLERIQDRLVLWTIWNSEPWVEVWLTKSGSFQVIQRTT
jgi:hypothetical protein